MIEKNKKKDEEEKLEKNLSWWLYLVKHSAIKEGMELLPPSCSLYRI
jgi:hypothetical protein